MEDEKYQKLRDYALRLLSFRPRSENEIRGKLTQYCLKRDIPPKIIEQVIKELTSQSFINDEEFAKWWVDQRRNFQLKGEKLIKIELKNKGIVKEIIDKVFKKDKKEENQEIERALQLAKKKIRLYENLSYNKAKIKLGNLLTRYGFEWDVIYKVIDSTIKKE